MIDKFHYGGIKVMIYVATGNAGRDLDSVLGEIETGLVSEVDSACSMKSRYCIPSRG